MHRARTCGFYKHERQGLERFGAPRHYPAGQRLGLSAGQRKAITGSSKNTHMLILRDRAERHRRVRSITSLDIRVRVTWSCGFTVTFHELNFILDGTQRNQVLRKLAEEGYHIPPLPCALITAKNKRGACEKILLISGQYGKMTNESLHEFISKNDLGFLELEDMLELPQTTWKSSRSGGCRTPTLVPRAPTNGS